MANQEYFAKSFAVLGSPELIDIFKVVGAATFSCDPNNSENMREQLGLLLNSGKYALVFVTDEVAHALAKELNVWRQKGLALSVLPKILGGKDTYGQDFLRQLCEKALGSNILKL